MSKRVLIGPQVFAHDRTYGSGYVAVSEGRIDDVGSADRSPDVEGNDVVRLPPDYAVVPGRIDIHVHGADGADTMDATPDALRTIAAALPKEGTTSFLATTATRSTDAIEAALRNAGEFIANHQRPGSAEVLGTDLEGPFVSADKPAHSPLNTSSSLISDHSNDGARSAAIRSRSSCWLPRSTGVSNWLTPCDRRALSRRSVTRTRRTTRP
jgi:N-acetylglucosamine-6-phosphate deacetylase